MSMDYGKLNFSTSFKPTSAFPLNANCYFESLAEAQAAAATAEEVGSSNTVYHFGQEIAVVESGVATLYMIQPDKTLKEVGKVSTGDDKTISVINEKIQLVGAADAAENSQPVMQKDGTIKWVVPSTKTTDDLQTEIDALKTDKADKTSVYTKAEVDAKVASVYKYCGSVDSYADLPTNLKNTDADIGKVYNVKTADKTHKIKAGDNVAWTGTDWDVLSGEVDLTSYYTSEQVDAELEKKVDKVEGSRLITDKEVEKFSKAEPNFVKSVDTEQFNVDDAGKLTLLEIAMAKVKGLADLKGKVDTLVGEDTDKSARTIAQEEVAKVPNASNTAFGLMKGSDDVTIADGQVTAVSTDILAQGKNTLVLDGGVFTD